MKQMTPEFDTRIADWLEDDPDKAPSIILETLVGALPAIPQRRSWRSLLLKFDLVPLSSIAAGLVLVAAVGVSAWMAGNRGGIGSVPTAAPSSPPATIAPSTPSAPPAPEATMRVLTAIDQGSLLRAGTYRIGPPFGVPLAITVGNDWRVDRVESKVLNLHGDLMDASGKSIGVSVDVVRPEKVFADACDPESANTVGSSVDELTSALTSIEGFTAGPVTDVIVDELTGKTFTLDNTIDMDTCGEGPRLMTYDRFGLDEPAFGSPDAHDRIWVLDIDGEPWVIDVRTYDDVTAAMQAQAEEIVDSIDFE